MAQQIRYYYASNTGKCRRTNQDNFYCNGHWMPAENQGTEGILSGTADIEKITVFGVFDGMGGEERGEMAAAIAAQQMQNADYAEGMEQAFFQYCVQANREICRYAQENGIGSTGTTAAIMGFHQEKGCLCNIGDSKIFQLSQKKLIQMSCDHVGIAAFGRKPPLSQNLGIPEEELMIEPYVASGPCEPGDVYLICSDGLTDMLSQEQIRDILLQNPGREAARLLMEGALAQGGKDNITFILLYVKKRRKKLLSFWKG